MIDLARPHDTNSLNGALLYALHIRSGAETTWEQLRQIRPTEAELERAVRSYFPVFLGFEADRQRGFTIGRGPEPYFVWGGSAGGGSRLSGAALLKRIRTVLGLPDRTAPPS